MAGAAGAAKKLDDPMAANQGAPAAEAARKIEQLVATRRKFAEFARNEHVIIAHASNTHADIIQPEYYAHVAHEMKARDRVEIWADDMSWFAQLVVLEVGKGWAKVYPLSLHEFGVANGLKGKVYERDGYRVLHRGEFSQWSVVRISDGEVVREGEGTQGGAIDWLDNHLKAQKR